MSNNDNPRTADKEESFSQNTNQSKRRNESCVKYFDALWFCYCKPLASPKQGHLLYPKELVQPQHSCQSNLNSLLLLTHALGAMQLRCTSFRRFTVMDRLMTALDIGQSCMTA